MIVELLLFKCIFQIVHDSEHHLVFKSVSYNLYTDIHADAVFSRIWKMMCNCVVEIVCVVLLGFQDFGHGKGSSGETGDVPDGGILQKHP